MHILELALEVLGLSLLGRHLGGNLLVLLLGSLHELRTCDRRTAVRERTEPRMWATHGTFSRSLRRAAQCDIFMSLPLISESNVLTALRVKASECPMRPRTLRRAPVHLHELAGERALVLRAALAHANAQLLTLEGSNLVLDRLELSGHGVDCTKAR